MQNLATPPGHVAKSSEIMLKKNQLQAPRVVQAGLRVVLGLIPWPNDQLVKMVHCVSPHNRCGAP